MKKLGNTVLVEHGIQTEVADYRAHVCPVVARIYVFPTGPAKELVERGGYRLRSTSINGVETARGAAVPIDDIADIQEVEMPEAGWIGLGFAESDTQTDKGRKAVTAVSWVLRRGLVRLPWSTRAASREADIVGVDLIATGRHLFQVKCDFKGGARRLGGTGNLFLQTMECNPFRMK
jgi:hypothetical protein